MSVAQPPAPAAQSVPPDNVTMVAPLLPPDETMGADLGDLLIAGNGLAAAVPGQDEPATAMDRAYREAEEWGGRVVDRLIVSKGAWKALFLDDSWGAQLFAENAPRHSTLVNWYERRLTRLRELILRVTTR